MDPAGSGTRGFGGPPRAPPADVDEVGTRGGGGVSPDEVSWDVRRLASAPPYVHQLLDARHQQVFGIYHVGMEQMKVLAAAFGHGADRSQVVVGQLQHRAHPGSAGGDVVDAGGPVPYDIIGSQVAAQHQDEERIRHGKE